MNTSDPYNRVIGILSIAISGLVGFLVAIPLSTTQTIPSIILFPLFTLGGLLAGYRRRHNRPFLYLALFALLTLTWLVLISWTPNDPSSHR